MLPLSFVVTASQLIRRLGPLHQVNSLVRYSTAMSNVEDVGESPGQPMSWKEAKSRYLSMPLKEKRHEYKCGNNYYSVEDIKTWYDYAIDNKHELVNKIPMLPENSIDESLNSHLSHKVSMFRGDITTLEIDAIVNAANTSLMGGGGCDGAIHSAAGEYLLEENKTLGGCGVGEAKITGGYKLPAKYVIATVGPQGEHAQQLRACYKNCIELMLSKNLKTVAFPCISTGIYGYPLKPAAHIAAMEVRKQLEDHDEGIDRVIFCLFSEIDEDIYRGILQTYFPLT